MGFFAVVVLYCRRSTLFSEQDPETGTWESKSRSEEMLQALGTFSSMDLFMMEGEKHGTEVAFYNLYWKEQNRKNTVADIESYFIC